MKREIKFRGIRTDGEGWAYGYYFKINWGSFIMNREGLKSEVEVDPASVGQYTGFKDKNGVYIYEGDILDFDANEWGGTCPPEVITMDLIIGEWKLKGSCDDLKNWRQVIGNIHQNQGLITTA